MKIEQRILSLMALHKNLQVSGKQSANADKASLSIQY